jgi:tRNA nucleotidyltransferase (CCA-adding enzyme)
VMVGKEGYEVTTFRVDGEYEDGRHPKSVAFTPNLTEDLKRRDFTINAMAYNKATGFVDEFGGVEDLRRGIIRCVGEPMDRFTEDALRILRAIRFSAQLGFEIEERTLEAIRVIAPNLAKVSKERVQVELTKLLCSAHPERIALVYETGISRYVSGTFHEIYGEGMPGTVNAPEDYSGVRTEENSPAASGGLFGPSPIPAIPVSIPPQKHLRWAAFLRKATPDQAFTVLKDLKLDNDTISRVKTLVDLLGQPLTPEKPDLRRVMSRIEPALYDDLLDLKEALLPFGVPETGDDLRRARALSGEIRRDGDCLDLKSLAVKGRDVMDAGVKPGKAVGETLAALLELVLEDPSRNTRDYLLQHLK